MRIDAASLDEAAAHDLLKACVAPRPIAWISTAGPNSVANAAPFSCFTFLSTRPPQVGFCIEQRGDSKKDTLINLERTGDFVVNVVTESLAEPMNRTADDYPPDVSEILEVGLTPVPGEQVRSPRIAECPISLECRVLDVIQLPASQHRFVVGQVLLFHVQDAVCKDGQIDHEALKPLARLAGNQYGCIGKVFELDRPWLSKETPENQSHER